ncbi:MAG: DUF4124 domain-containing protein [Thiobacillaceae bacterium]|jgi:hypothetical protein|nr:DUF4124 domain-containing protein [Thiobacillaceae bacterium]
MRRLLIALLFACGTVPAQAEIYKFVDEQGNVTYTNMPRPGAKALQLDAPGTPTGSKPDATGGKSSRAKPKATTPGYFPKVDSSTQRRRDDMRRQLLVEEMRSEERNLSAARAALAGAGRKPGADVNKLAESVRMHEKNIEMLNKELSHIR